MKLEQFLKDLSEINGINTSKPFRKFLEFEQYIDDDNEVMYKVGHSSMRGNYNSLGDNRENINYNNNDDRSLDDYI